MPLTVKQSQETRCICHSQNHSFLNYKTRYWSFCSFLFTVDQFYDEVGDTTVTNKLLYVEIYLQHV